MLFACIGLIQAPTVEQLLALARQSRAAIESVSRDLIQQPAETADEARVADELAYVRLPNPSDTRPQYLIALHSSTFWFNAQGNLDGCSYHMMDRSGNSQAAAAGEWQANLRISDANAIELANRYYASLGRSSRLLADHIDELRSSNEGTLQVYAEPSVAGIPYFGVTQEFDLNYKTGLLQGFSLRNVPRQPTSLSAGISPSDALSAACDAVLRSRPPGLVLEVTQQPRLVAWPLDQSDSDGGRVPRIPMWDGLVNTLSEEDYALARSGDSRLAYTLWLEKASSARRPPRYADGYDGYRASIDANSGRVLKIHFSVFDPEMATFGGGKKKGGNAITWTWQRGPVQLWAAPSHRFSGIVEPVSASSVTEGSCLVVRAAKRYTQAHYDVSKNLLWVEAGGKRTYARPDANLRKALAHALAVQKT